MVKFDTLQSGLLGDWLTNTSYNGRLHESTSANVFDKNTYVQPQETLHINAFDRQWGGNSKDISVTIPAQNCPTYRNCGNKTDMAGVFL